MSIVFGGRGNCWTWTYINGSVEAMAEARNVVFGRKTTCGILDYQGREAYFEAIREMHKKGDLQIESKVMIQERLNGSVESREINGSFTTSDSIVDWDRKPAIGY